MSACGGSRPPPCPNWSTTPPTRATGVSRAGSPTVSPRSTINTAHYEQLYIKLEVAKRAMERAIIIGVSLNVEFRNIKSEVVNSSQN